MPLSGPNLDQLLREADSLLLGLLGNAMVGVYVIQDDRFVHVNAWFADLFGYSQSALCGGLGPMDLTAPEDRELARREIDRRIRGEIRSSSYAFRGLRRDGGRIDAEVFGVATRFAGRPAIIGMLHDVSERIVAEQAVADQLSFVAKLVETIPNPVFYKDEEGVYLGCNAAFEDFLGLPRERIVGRSVYQISPPDLAARYDAADRALFDNPGRQTYESSVANDKGERRDVLFYKATFDKADGSLGGLVGVVLDITERKRLEETVWRQANYDALTGLPNHRLLRETLREQLRMARRHGHRLALLFIDLDRFKEVNDTLGHDVGDRLLVQAAERIRESVRASDLVARQGGDEFLVTLPEVASGDAAGQVADGIVEALGRPFDLDGRQAYVSASVGIAIHPDDADDIDTLMRYADQAMYMVKNGGRDGVGFFSHAMQEQSQRRHAVAGALRGALAAGQFELHYQPIVDLADGRVTKAEALLRWTHPQLGAVGPSEFIPIAEEIGLIGDIGRWVAREAIATAAAWHRAHPAHPIQFSINASPKQFHGGGFIDCVLDLAQAGLAPESIAVEITEGLLLDDRPSVIDTLLAFRDAHIQVSLDDFGTGYSALSYLKKFDIDYLKIDRSFVRDLASDRGDLAIAEAMIVMAHKLGIAVIAEGVETEEQRRLLAEAGCDYAQGFLFARPMPAAAFFAFVAAGADDT